MKDKQNHFDAQHHPSQPASSEPVSPTQDKKLSRSLPQGSHTHQQNSLKGSEYLSALVEQRSHLLVCWLGYGLLVFAAFDYIQLIYSVIPPRFTNPLWEFQTIGALVEHVVSPLLGLMFVFYRHQGYIRKWERKLLGFLSWVSLLAGLLFLLMLPLGVADTWRIYNANKAEVAANLFQQSQPFQQLKVQLNQAKTDKQIEQLVASLTPQGRLPQIKNTQAYKNQLLVKISQAQQRMQVQAETVAAAQRQELIKNSVKWNLGALVVGTLFIWIWYLTDWARLKD